MGQSTKKRLACLEMIGCLFSPRRLSGNRAVAGNHAKKAAELHGIILERSYLEPERDKVWNRMDLGDLTDNVALKRNQELQR